MNKARSYFSKPYAPAWGMLIGTAVGVAIELAMPSTSPGLLVGVLSLAGLIIGYVISQSGEQQHQPDVDELAQNVESRLRLIEQLRSRTVITDEEYQRRREEIISKL